MFFEYGYMQVDENSDYSSVATIGFSLNENEDITRLMDWAYINGAENVQFVDKIKRIAECEVYGADDEDVINKLRKIGINCTGTELRNIGGEDEGDDPEVVDFYTFTFDNDKAIVM